MGEEKPWTDIERLVLIRSSREMIPEMAEAMGRPFRDVMRKFEDINAILEGQFEKKAKRYVEMGFGQEEAFLKAADEGEMDLKELRELEKREATPLSSREHGGI